MTQFEIEPEEVYTPLEEQMEENELDEVIDIDEDEMDEDLDDLDEEDLDEEDLDEDDEEEY